MCILADKVRYGLARYYERLRNHNHLVRDVESSWQYGNDTRSNTGSSFNTFHNHDVDLDLHHIQDLLYWSCVTCFTF